MFFKKRRKKKKLKKFLIHLKRLLRKRYGRSRHYTKAQVERTVEQEKLDGKFLWHGYLCFVDPAIINQVILGDQPVDTEEVLSDIGELFSIDVNESGVDAVQDAVDGWQSSGLDYGFDSSFDGGFRDGGDGD
ncbi:MAG: hypothetical protein WBM35_17170 [Candidatus Electrothrix sp.]